MKGLAAHRNFKTTAIAQCFDIAEDQASRFLESLDLNWPANWATVAQPEQIDVVLTTLGKLFAQIEHSKRKNRINEAARQTT